MYRNVLSHYHIIVLQINGPWCHGGGPTSVVCNINLLGTLGLMNDFYDFTLNLIALRVRGGSKGVGAKGGPALHLNHLYIIPV